MNNVTISIEMRIEAGSESAAREYAAMYGIDVTLAKWQRNCNGKGGRLYVVGSAPLSVAKHPQEAAESLPDKRAVDNI